MTNRERIISLLKYLYINTDDEHQVDTGELTMAILGEDTPAKRKTIKEDILFLESQEGIDIVIHKGSPDMFQWGNRLFDTAEVKFLIDSVASSNMMTSNRSERVIGKLSTLVSEHEQKKLNRHLYIPSHLKTENVQVFYTIDKVADALEEGKKVEFKYLFCNVDMEQQTIIREVKPTQYRISPYSMVLDHGRYYLIGHYEEKDIVCPFRIDRITDLKIIDEPAECDSDFCIEEYLDGVFKMFTGRKVDVVLECKNEWINSVRDHFGSDLEIEQVSDKAFRLKLRVQLSPTFYAWIFEAGSKVKIIEPEDVVEEYIGLLKGIIKDYT